MNTIQLNAVKLDIIECLLGIDNEKSLAKILSLVRKSAKDDLKHIPGLPYTSEERIASVREAVEDYRATGKSFSQEEMEKWVDEL